MHGERQAAAERVLSLVSRIFVWGIFFGTLFVLRSFFLLIFLTFVFCYIQSHGVERIEHRLPNRSLAVCVVGFAFLMVLVSIGWFLIPRVIEQAKLVADRHNSYFQTLDEKVVGLLHTYPALGAVVGETVPPHGDAPQLSSPAVYDSENSISLRVLQQLAGFQSDDSPGSNLTHLVELTRNIGQPLLAIGSAFFLSLLFSFLIILDLPRLTQSVKSLADSKLAFIYEEVEPSVVSFATVLGRAFQAQLMIALVNTTLTAGIIYVLGLHKSLAFLSLIVFFCGFIPVAGVFISSVPICLMVLQQSGPETVLLAVLLIWFVHLIEAYILNPRIFGGKLKINPVIVLIILTVSGKLFGVWGLILSLPVYTYLFGYAIRREGYIENLEEAQTSES
jgi:predicted PurR-regulated permease PerM